MPRSGLFIDIGPLRTYRQFRLLWTGFLIRTIGNQLTVVAVPYEVYRLTHSSLDVGLVSLAQIGPLLVGSLLGGTIVDAFDRRRLLIMTQLLLASTSLGLALNSGYHKPALWPIFLCSALAAGYQGIDSPASTALVVSVVGREGIVGANALWQALFSVGQIAGPAVAGLLLARISINFVYWIDVTTYGASLIAVLRMARPPKIDGANPRELGFGAMVGGLRYLKGHQPLEGIFIADLIAMTLGMPRALFPAMGLVRFHGGAGTVGLLYAAPGTGALVGALLTGWVRGVKRQGRAVMLAVVGWGVAITLFGLSPWLAPALILLGAAGASDVFSAVFRGSILQLETPPGLLGRMQAVQIAVVTGGPRFGDLEHGAVAALLGPVTAVVSGGLACIAGVAVLAKALPKFTHLALDTTKQEVTVVEGDEPSPPPAIGG
jgi:MFS family permease